jgi:hypothetical protein
LLSPEEDLQKLERRMLSQEKHLAESSGRISDTKGIEGGRHE